MLIVRLKSGASPFLLSALLLSSLVTAATVNRTIDDTLGDSQTGQLVTYTPASTSETIWQTANDCIGCEIHPEASQLFDGTYTAATFRMALGEMGITMEFSGTAIYVFFVLANNQGQGIVTGTVANFSIDGAPPQLFQHSPDTTITDLQYSQMVFSQKGLPNANHTLTISYSSVSDEVWICFDYAIYTHVDETSALPPSSSPGMTTGVTTTSSTSESVSTASRGSESTTNTSPTSLSTPTTIGGGSTASMLSTQATGATTLESNTSPSTTAANGGASTTPSLGDTSRTSSHVSIGAVAGGVIGGIAILVLLVILFIVLQRRKRRQKNAFKETGQPASFMHEWGHERRPTVGSVSPFTDAGWTPASVTHGTDTAATDSSSRSLKHSEAMRAARQNEINERLQFVRREMMDLSSQVGLEETGAGRNTRNSVGSQPQPRALIGAGAPVELESAQGGEVSNPDVQQQLRSMMEQIAYLQEQQRSAWAQGLSNNPPPGYSPTGVAGYSAPRGHV